MRIGLIPIEPKIVNTAYMQIAEYHRNKGDEVAWWLPLEDGAFDKVYCSSIFSFTDRTEVPLRAIAGGTGYADPGSLRLPTVYDYSIYPKCDYSIVRFSRGCIRKCPFCLVPRHEGRIHPAYPPNLNPNGNAIHVYDNNFFANPEWPAAIKQLQEWGQPVDFNQAVDARIMTDEMCEAVQSLKLQTYLRIAWDNPRVNMVPHIERLLKYYRPYKIFCYMLIGYWSTEREDVFRAEALKELGVQVFAMPYNKKDPYQKRFARWVNHKAIFKSVKWKDYNG